MKSNTYKPYLPERAITIQHFYTLFERGYNNDYIFPGETHDFWEIVCVRNGHICVCADERIFHLSKGDVIFHKPMELHKFHMEGSETTTLFITSFTAFGTGMKQFENQVLRLSQEQDLLLSEIIAYLQRECSDAIQNPFGCLNIFKNNPVKFHTFTCMLELWLLSLAKGNAAVKATTNTTETITFQKAVQTMEKHVNEWMSVPAIAYECNVSVSYLKKIFSKYTGFGIHQYFLKLKIARASQMLKNGKNVTEISDFLSFCNPNYFSNVFRRETGYTPSEYKNRVGG